MSVEPKTTTIPDKDGNPHEYETILFGAKAALALLPKVTKVIADPLGKGIAALLGAAAKDGDLQSAAKAFQESQDDPTHAAGGVLSGLDADGVGAAFVALAERIQSEGGADLFVSILRHTTRDGKDVGSSERFDMTYQGDLGEMFHAVGWVLFENFGPVFDRPFVAAGLPGLRTLLKRRS